jgi:hypothetical protein
MKEDNQTPPQPPAPATRPFPALPEGFQIPSGLVDQWLAIPWNQIVEPKLSKQEWEFLFFALTKMTSAQQQTNDCIVKWSNGDTLGANEAMDAARRTTIEADNQFRQFFTALIGSALRK